MKALEQIFEMEITPKGLAGAYDIILKGDWGPEEEALHPRAAAGASGGRGGQFVKKFEGSSSYFLKKAGRNARIRGGAITAAISYATSLAIKKRGSIKSVEAFRSAYKDMMRRGELPQIPASEKIEALETKISDSLVGHKAIADANDKVIKVLSKAEIRMNRGLKGALGTIRGGRVKTTHEAGIRGTDSETTRRFCESRFLDLPKKYPDTIRPVYGYITDKSDIPIRSYGDYCFVFKDHMKARTTVTGNDSWFSRHEWRGSPYTAYYGSTVANPSIVSFLRKPERTLNFVNSEGISIGEYYKIKRKLQYRNDMIEARREVLNTEMNEKNRLLYNEIQKVLKKHYGKQWKGIPDHWLFSDVGKEWVGNEMPTIEKISPKIKRDFDELMKVRKRYEAYDNAALEIRTKKREMHKNLKINFDSRESKARIARLKKALKKLTKIRRDIDAIDWFSSDIPMSKLRNRSFRSMDAYRNIKGELDEISKIASAQREIVENTVEEIRDMGKLTGGVRQLIYYQKNESLYIEAQIQHGARMRDIEKILVRNAEDPKSVVLVALEAEKRGIPLKFKFENTDGKNKEISIKNYLNILHSEHLLKKRSEELYNRAQAIFKDLTDQVDVLPRDEFRRMGDEFTALTKKSVRMKTQAGMIRYRYLEGAKEEEFIEASLLYYKIKKRGGLDMVKRIHDHIENLIHTIGSPGDLSLVEIGRLGEELSQKTPEEFELYNVYRQWKLDGVVK